MLKSHDERTESAEGREPLPPDPRAHAAEAVEALQGEDPVTAHEAEEVPAEDTSENPDDEGMEQLPGPSGGSPNEPAG